MHLRALGGGGGMAALAGEVLYQLAGASGPKSCDPGDEGHRASAQVNARVLQQVSAAQVY